MSNFSNTEISVSRRYATHNSNNHSSRYHLCFNVLKENYLVQVFPRAYFWDYHRQGDRWLGIVIVVCYPLSI